MMDGRELYEQNKDFECQFLGREPRVWAVLSSQEKQRWQELADEVLTQDREDGVAHESH